MKNAILVPVERLEPLTATARARVAAELPAVSVEPGGLGDLLAWALLFEYWPRLLPGPPLDGASAFYNRYFWLRRFATLKQRRDGYDAGLEQHVSRALEQVDFDPDWELVEELDRAATAA